jgi:hypothetical protein
LKNVINARKRKDYVTRVSIPSALDICRKERKGRRTLDVGRVAKFVHDDCYFEIVPLVKDVVEKRLRRIPVWVFSEKGSIELAGGHTDLPEPSWPVRMVIGTFLETRLSTTGSSISMSSGLDFGHLARRVVIMQEGPPYGSLSFSWGSESMWTCAMPVCTCPMDMTCVR